MEEPGGGHESQPACRKWQSPEEGHTPQHLGRQVLGEAVGKGLRRRVRGPVAEWVTTTIHLAAIHDVARVFTEQVLAQVVARTRGALPSQKDVYRLAAPMGRVWRRKIQVHLKLDSSTV